MKQLRSIPLVVGMLLLVCGSGAAQGYKVQSVLKTGDQLGGVTLNSVSLFWSVGGLTDAGQIAVVTTDQGGGDLLIQTNPDRAPTVIVSPNGEAPGGTWPQKGSIGFTPSMNQAGNIVFKAAVRRDGRETVGTFLWDAEKRQAKVLAAEGIPAVNSLTFAEGGSGRINNQNEIALTARVKNAAGQSFPAGVFLVKPDAPIEPVALPGQELLPGTTVVHASSGGIDDAGRIGLLVQRKGDAQDSYSAYLWEKGTVVPVALVGGDAPGGRKIGSVWSMTMNDADRSVLLYVGLEGLSEAFDGAVYRSLDGKLLPVTLADRGAPGTLASISAANSLGQVAIVVERSTESRIEASLYVLNADGTVSHVVTEGKTKTDLGTIDGISRMGIAINNKGQIAVAIRVENQPVEHLVLLTPPQ